MHLKTPILLLLISMSVNAPSSTLAASGKTSSPTPLALSAQDSEALKRLYQQLIEAENRHDIAAVKSFVWVSPSTLFVAKTATAAEGNWAGFWGSDVVLQHLDDLYKAGPFHIEPDYDKEKVVALGRDVAETYLPVSITVAYAGQDPVPKPFLMILDWVRTKDGWRMATDIALPIPLMPKP